MHHAQIGHMYIHTRGYVCIYIYIHVYRCMLAVIPTSCLTPGITL